MTDVGAQSPPSHLPTAWLLAGYVALAALAALDGFCFVSIHRLLNKRLVCVVLITKVNWFLNTQHTGARTHDHSYVKLEFKLVLNGRFHSIPIMGRRDS